MLKCVPSSSCFADHPKLWKHMELRHPWIQWILKGAPYPITQITQSICSQCHFCRLDFPKVIIHSSSLFLCEPELTNKWLTSHRIEERRDKRDNTDFILGNFDESNWGKNTGRSCIRNYGNIQNSILSASRAQTQANSIRWKCRFHESQSKN